MFEKTCETGKTDSEKIDGSLTLSENSLNILCDLKWHGWSICVKNFFSLKIKTTYFSMYKWKSLKKDKKVFFFQIWHALSFLLLFGDLICPVDAQNRF